jgi:hypothetical protein
LSDENPDNIDEVISALAFLLVSCLPAKAQHHVYATVNYSTIRAFLTNILAFIVIIHTHACARAHTHIHTQFKLML